MAARCSRSSLSRIAASGALFLALIAYAPGFQEDGPKWLVLLLALAAAAWAGFGLDRKSLSIVVFAGWAGLSLLWAPDRAAGIVHMAGILVFCGLFFLGRSGLVHRAVIPLVLGAILLYWLLGLDNGGLGNPNFLAEFIVASLPAVFFLHKHLRWPAVAVGILALALVDSRTGFFALWLAGIGWLAWKRSFVLAGILFLLPVNLAMFGPLDVTASVKARVEIWINTAAMIMENPLFGHGAGSFDYLYPKFEAVHLNFFPGWGFYHPISVYAGAAHNEPLQIVAEFGLVGLALAGWLLKECLGKPSPVQAWTLGLIGACAMIGFPLQNPCTMAVFALTLGEAAGPAPAWKGWAAGSVRLAGSAVFAVFALFMLRTLQGQWEWQGVIVHFKNDPAAAVAANVRAYEAAPWDFKFRYQMYPTLAKASYQPNVIVKPSAFEKAWAISMSASPYSRYLGAVRRDIARKEADATMAP